ncbi:MAG: ribosome silencing factor [Mariprofundaceae bacterium]|nr:ribosome silencing factor [Mariprofundaceae bacterium]
MSENKTLETLTQAVTEALDDKKAQDVVLMDVQGQCSFADYFVLATGRTDRQLKAMAQAVSSIAHDYGMPAKIEGTGAMEWLIVDLGGVVVHLFLPDVRASLQLERLWTLPASKESLESSSSA